MAIWGTIFRHQNIAPPIVLPREIERNFRIGWRSATKNTIHHPAIWKPLKKNNVIHWLIIFLDIYPIRMPGLMVLSIKTPVLALFVPFQGDIFSKIPWFPLVFLVYHGFGAENHLKSARNPASTPCARRALRGSPGFGFGFAAPGASRCRPPGRPRRGLGDTLEILDIFWGNGGKMKIEFRWIFRK